CRQRASTCARRSSNPSVIVGLLFDRRSGIRSELRAERQSSPDACPASTRDDAPDGGAALEQPVGPTQATSVATHTAGSAEGHVSARNGSRRRERFELLARTSPFIATASSEVVQRRTLQFWKQLLGAAATLEARLDRPHVFRARRRFRHPR